MKKLFILLFLLLPLLAMAQPLEPYRHNFFTTNPAPVVDVVAGSNVFITPILIGTDTRRFRVDMPASGAATNIMVSAAGTNIVIVTNGFVYTISVDMGFTNQFATTNFANGVTNGFPWGVLYDPAGAATAATNGYVWTNLTVAMAGAVTNGWPWTNLTVAHASAVTNGYPWTNLIVAYAGAVTNGYPWTNLTVAHASAVTNGYPWTNVTVATAASVVGLNTNYFVLTNDTRPLNLTNSFNHFGGDGGGLTNVPFSVWTNWSKSYTMTNLNGIGFSPGFGMVDTWLFTNVPSVGPVGVRTLEANTNCFITTNGGTFYQPILSGSSSTNAPANNELVTASWVRSLFNNGVLDYATTNIDSVATNIGVPTPVYTFATTIPPPASRSYVNPTNNQYIGSVITTNTFQFLQGPISVNAFMALSTGGSDALSVHPEIYYSYDKTNWSGDWEASNQSITKGVTNLYQWVISFPTVTATNTAGFYLERRFKVGVAGGTPTVTFLVGTNTASGTNNASHIAFSGPSSQSGDAFLGANQTFTGTNTFAQTIVGSITGNAATATTATNDDLGNKISSYYSPLNGNAAQYWSGWTNVVGFGAVGDCVSTYGANMSNGVAAVWCTNVVFTTNDIGKKMVIIGAGNQFTAPLGGTVYDPLFVTITNVPNSNTVLVTSAPLDTSPSYPSTLWSLGQGFMYYGTDNQAAFQNAFNYCVSNSIWNCSVPKGDYLIGGSFSTAGGRNALVYLPDIPNNGLTTICPTFRFVGAGNPSPGGYALNMTGKGAGQSGSTIWCGVMGNTNNGSLFQVAWAGPTEAFIHFQVEDLGIRMPPDAQCSAIDSYYCSSAAYYRVYIDSILSSYSGMEPTYSGSYGIKMPLSGNNGPAKMLLMDTYISGMYNGLLSEEHTVCIGVFLNQCKRGLYMDAGNHSVNCIDLRFQTCATNIVVGGASELIGQLDFEHAAPGRWNSGATDVYDPSSVLRGAVSMRIAASGSGPTNYVTIGATNLHVLFIDRTNTFGIYGDAFSSDGVNRVYMPTNAPTDGQTIAATGTGGATKWSNASAAQTPITSDINYAGFSATNMNTLSVTNGIFITGSMYPVASMVNGQVQFWNSNAVVYLIRKDTAGTVTTNLITTSPAQ